MDTNNDQLLHPLLSNMDNFGRYGSSSNLSDNSSISSSRPSSSARGSLLGQSHEHHRDLRSSSTGIQDNVDDVRFEEIPPDDVTLLQACVFIEDAIHYRSIHHRVDPKSLRLYRKYYSRLVQWGLYIAIFIIHALAFIEKPSSLTKTADLRTKGDSFELPCGVTETLELICLIIFVMDLITKSYFKGKALVKKDKWLIAYCLILLVSLVDWFVSVGMGCPDKIRIRRVVRPFFLLQNSPLMKKTVKSIRRTLPQVASVLLLLFMHLYFFTMFGMLLFPKNHHESPDESAIDDEYTEYFNNIIDAFVNMLVLLTTANNPDVTLPAYNANRFYAIFFIVFLVIGLYCLMNMLTAVIYNQFRGYFMNSMQASLFRRRLGIRTAFEVLRRRKVAIKLRSPFDTVSQAVPSSHVAATLQQCTVSLRTRRLLLLELKRTPRTMLNSDHFVAVFNVLERDQTRQMRPDIRQMRSRVAIVLQRAFTHRYFTMAGFVIAAVNVLIITIELAREYEKVRNSSNTYLGLANMVIIPLYLLEQLLKMWALGASRYFWDKGNVFDILITVSLVIVQIIYLAVFGIPYWGHDVVPPRGSVTLWDLVRIINMLILIKLLRVIMTQFKAMYIVTSTIYDLIRNLKAFAGLLAIAYYSYALLGMMLFQKKVVYETTDANITNGTMDSNTTTADLTHTCGSYEQLNYWSNNFDDFSSSLVVLWNVMVVNNWHVFLGAFSRFTNKWSQLYFIIWWLISVVVALNLFTAIVLENFTTRWDRAQQLQQRARAETVDSWDDSFRTEDLTVHDIFRHELQEPSEQSVVSEIRQHPYLQLQTR